MFEYLEDGKDYHDLESPYTILAQPIIGGHMNHDFELNRREKNGWI